MKQKKEEVDMWPFTKEHLCQHDWEEVWATLSPAKHLQSYLPEDWTTKELEWKSCSSDWELYYKGDRVHTDMNSHCQWVGKKVCVKCGECVDEMQDFADKIVAKATLRLAEEKADRQRKIIAKKMWNECEKRGEV